MAGGLKSDKDSVLNTVRQLENNIAKVFKGVFENIIFFGEVGSTLVHNTHKYFTSIFLFYKYVLMIIYLLYLVD